MKQKKPRLCAFARKIARKGAEARLYKRLFYYSKLCVIEHDLFFTV